MAWNEPGNNGKRPDPWGGRKEGQGPPDLDDALAKLFKQLGALFGGGKPQGNGSQNSSPLKKAFGSAGFLVGLVIILVIWGLSGFYIVQEAERAVVLRFGQFHEVSQPGLKWYARFIDTVEVIDIKKIYAISERAEMLTADENIIHVELGVQYQIENARSYLFNVVDPALTLKQATKSAIRHVIGQSDMDEILQGGREVTRQQTKDRLDAILAPYQSGVVVTDITLQEVRAPEQVKAAFDDAIKAREDKRDTINKAQAYAREVEPIARGRAKRIEQEAQAYRQQVTLLAEGETQKFAKLLVEYEKAPEVTKKRMYLDTMEVVYSQVSKVVVDGGDGSNNLLYLPLDKIISSGGRQSRLNDVNNSDASTPNSTLGNNTSQIDSRSGRNLNGNRLRKSRGL